MIIVTNNEKVMGECKDNYEIQWVEGAYGDVLKEVRNRIHKGHRLISHPLSGSIKPNETPFKSVIISKRPEKLDHNSLMIIENSIQTYLKFMKNPVGFGDTNKEQLLDDFREVDFRLLSSAVKSASE